MDRSSLPAFAFARVKCNEMSTQDDALLGNSDILLPAIEEVLVDPPLVKTEPKYVNSLGYPQPDIPEEIDPLLLPDEVTQEPKLELPFAGSVAIRGQTVTKPSKTRGRMITRSSTARDHKVAFHANTQDQKVTESATAHGHKVAIHTKTRGRTVTESATAQGHKVAFHTKTRGQKMTGVAGKESGKMFTGSRVKQEAPSHSGKKRHECTKCDDHTVAFHADTQDQKVTESAAAQGHKVAFHTKTRGQKMTGVAGKECGKMFTGSRVKKEAPSHSGKKRHECTECDYRTANSSHLKRHAIRHVGERPYACTESKCDYRTSQRCDLESHLRTHAPEKPCRTADDDGNPPSRVSTHTREKPCSPAERYCHTATEDENSPSPIHFRTADGPYPLPEATYRTVVMMSLDAHKRLADEYFSRNSHLPRD